MYNPIAYLFSVLRFGKEPLTQSALEERIAKFGSLPWGRHAVEHFRSQLVDVVIASFPDKLSCANLLTGSSLKICKIDRESLDLSPPVYEQDGIVELGAERLLSPAYLRMMSTLNRCPSSADGACPRFLIVGIRRKDAENSRDFFDFELILEYREALSVSHSCT